VTTTAFVLRDARGGLADGWLVAWKPEADGWRAEVQGRDGATLPVSFACTVGDDGLLDVAGSGGFTAVKAKRDILAPLQQASDSAVLLGQALRDCWRCLSDTRDAVADPMLKSLLDETFYSLRSCRAGMSAAARALPPDQVPARCKRR